MRSIEDFLQEGSKEIVRSHLRKIVEIYDLEWVVAHELVQNAIDAVQLNPLIERGEVQLTLDFDTDEVTIRDNGTGFKHDLDLLRPGGSGDEKRLAARSPAKGYQGVGLKAVMYSTTRFELESVREGKRWTFISQGLSSYIQPNSTNVPTYEERSEPTTNNESYTIVKAQFPKGYLARFLEAINRHLGQDTVKWMGLYREEAEEGNGKEYDAYLSHYIGWYFRTKSYVGCYNSLLNVAVSNPLSGNYEHMKPIDIRVTLRSTEGFTSLAGKIGEWLKGLDRSEFVTLIPYKAWDFAEVAKSNHDRKSRYRLAPEVISMKPNDSDWDTLKVTFRDKFLDLKLTPNDKAAEFRDKYADFISVMERPRSRVNAEAFEDVFEHITGIYISIGRTSHFETLGVPNSGDRIIASNGTPTAHEITVRTTSSTWYLETIQFVVNVDQPLNIGKRHLVNTRLVGRIREFFEACYPKLVSISKLFVERDSIGGGEDAPMPDVLPLGKIHRKGIAFRRFPADESSLVGLFSVLISSLDHEFSVYGLFSSARYDGKFTWRKTSPSSDHELKRLEFKQKLNRLIDEFEAATHEKEFKEVALVIVWDRRTDKPGWTVKGISDPRRTKLEEQGVPTDLVEYVLEDHLGHYCALICVADLLQKIPLEEEGVSDDVNRFVEEMG
jgi:hypothetical protein